MYEQKAKYKIHDMLTTCKLLNFRIKKIRKNTIKYLYLRDFFNNYSWYVSSIFD